MKTFRVITLEQEQWERIYIVKASTKKSAYNKILKGDADCVDGEMYNYETDLKEIETLY